MDTFKKDGSYNKTQWINGDTITSERLNKVEDALYQINDDYVDADYVNRAVINAAIGGGVDISDYALKTDIPSLDGYATEDYVNNAIGDIDAILDAINGEVL